MFNHHQSNQSNSHLFQNQSFSQLRVTQLSMNIEDDSANVDSYVERSPSYSIQLSPSNMRLRHATSNSPELRLNPVQEEQHNDDRDEDENEKQADQDSELDDREPIRRRFRIIRYQVPAYGKTLYSRNHLSICRGISFGILGIAPYVVIAFLSDFQPLIKYLIVALQVFGILDVLVFFAYEDKLNDMFHSGNFLKYPRGCRSHTAVGLIMSLLLIMLLSAIIFNMLSSNYVTEHFVFVASFSLVGMLYFMALCSLKAVIAYLVILAALLWFILAIFISLVVFFIMCATCGKVVLSRKNKYLFNQTKYITFSQIKKLRERQGNDFCCSVCLDELRPGDKVLELPCNQRAHHFFHYKCGTQWLAQHHTCPMCRKDYEANIDKNSVWHKIWLFKDMDV